MAKKKKRGGKREGAGRKPNPVKKRKMTVSIPIECYDEIKAQTKKKAEACEKRCKRKL